MDTNAFLLHQKLNNQEMTFVERHCITFDQAKELSELGVPNISAFKYRKDGSVIYPSKFFDRAWESDGRTYPCFTDSELRFITETNNYSINVLMWWLANKEPKYADVRNHIILRTRQLLD